MEALLRRLAVEEIRRVFEKTDGDEHVAFGQALLGETLYSLAGVSEVLRPGSAKLLRNRSGLVLDFTDRAVPQR